MANNTFVRELREKTNMGLIECAKALSLFNNNIIQAEEYLKIRFIAVCRRKPDKSLWEEEDYVEYIKKNFPSDK